MKLEINYNLLTRKLFIIGLLLLILNDFYFKYNYPNFITGKLSDFAGLFIFPYFFSVFFQNHLLKIYFSTAIFFIFWKLEISQEFIIYFSEFTNFAINRTVDITDLIALSILPLSHGYFKKMQEIKSEKSLVLNSLVGSICVYSFIATTNPREFIEVNLKSNNEYDIALSKKQVFEKLGYESNDKINDLTIDFNIPYHNAYATAKITVKEISQNQSKIQLDSILNCTVNGTVIIGISQSDINDCKKLRINDFEKYFEDEFMRPNF